MKAAVFIALFLPAAASANFAECLLDKLPGTANDVAAHAIMQTCTAKHPGGFQSVVQGSGRGWFGFKSGPECTAKKAADTRSNRAAQLISVACRNLYDKPPKKLIPYNGKMLTIDEFLNAAPEPGSIEEFLGSPPRHE